MNYKTALSALAFCRRISILAIVLVFLPATLCANGKFADSHIHYNQDHRAETSVEEVVEILVQHNVGLTIVAGTPSHLALELREQAGDWVIPFFSPYIHTFGKRDWYLDEQVVVKAEQGLRDGRYFGIGEVHFMSGFKPRTTNPIFLKLLELAKKFDVPMMVHSDSGNEQTFLRLCSENPHIRLIFAHAGGNLKPRHIEKILGECNNVWMDFAARDPWRYDGISKEDHTLRDGWKALVIKYPHRFITGTDPVWKVTRVTSWDSDDEGWTHYEQLYNFHWTWLNDLPENIRQMVAWENTFSVLKMPLPKDM